MIDDSLTDENAVFFHPKTAMSLWGSSRLGSVTDGNGKTTQYFYGDDPEYPGKNLGEASHLREGVAYRRISPKPIGKSDYGVQSFLRNDLKQNPEAVGIVRISYDNHHMEFAATIPIAEMKRRFEEWYLKDCVRYVPISCAEDVASPGCVPGSSSEVQSWRVNNWFDKWLNKGMQYD